MSVEANVNHFKGKGFFPDWSCLTLLLPVDLWVIISVRDAGLRLAPSGKFRVSQKSRSQLRSSSFYFAGFGPELMLIG